MIALLIIVAILGTSLGVASLQWGVDTRELRLR
jgi:hypothetical protein